MVDCNNGTCTGYLDVFSNTLNGNGQMWGINCYKASNPSGNFTTNSSNNFNTYTWVCQNPTSYYGAPNAKNNINQFCYSLSQQMPTSWNEFNATAFNTDMMNQLNNDFNNNNDVACSYITSGEGLYCNVSPNGAPQCNGYLFAGPDDNPAQYSLKVNCTRNQTINNDQLVWNCSLPDVNNNNFNAENLPSSQQFCSGFDANLNSSSTSKWNELYADTTSNSFNTTNNTYQCVYSTDYDFNVQKATTKDYANLAGEIFDTAGTILEALE